MKPFKYEGSKLITLNLAHKDIICDLSNVEFDAKLIDPSHPVYMLTKLKKGTERYLNAITDCFRVLPPGLEVLEFCGGIGLLPESVWDFMRPRVWRSIELDKGCVEANICKRPNYIRFCGDMYKQIWLNAYSGDLIHMDWPTMTLRKMWGDPQVKDFMTRVTDCRPKYLGITDIETGWIHMPNHWPHYAELFKKYLGWKERPVSTEKLRNGYVRIYDHYMLDNYGYEMIKSTRGGGGDYMMFERV